uniref:Uncharacterized protein n=1 Tax=Ditylenchus dipsaci TaxID=166011 RepID=A0A915ENR5_9BILA
MCFVKNFCIWSGYKCQVDGGTNERSRVSASSAREARGCNQGCGRDDNKMIWHQSSTLPWLSAKKIDVLSGNSVMQRMALSGCRMCPMCLALLHPSFRRLLHSNRSAENHRPPGFAQPMPSAITDTIIFIMPSRILDSPELDSLSILAQLRISEESMSRISRRSPSQLLHLPSQRIGRNDWQSALPTSRFTLPWSAEGIVQKITGMILDLEPADVLDIIDDKSCWRVKSRKLRSSEQGKRIFCLKTLEETFSLVPLNDFVRFVIKLLKSV